MKKIIFPFLVLLALAFLRPSPALAMNEVCTDTAANCCNAVQIVQDGGGCPTGTVWIGGNDGSCVAPTSCSGTQQFSCATNACISQLPPSGPGPACPGRVEISGQCYDIFTVIKDRITATLYKIWSGSSILGRLVYVLDTDCTAGQVPKWNNTTKTWACADDSAGSSQWTTNGSNISYSAGNVGINTSTPTTSLDVNGSTTLRGSVNIIGSSVTLPVGTIQSREIADGAVTGTDIASHTITNSNIAYNTIGNSELNYYWANEGTDYLTDTHPTGVALSSCNDGGWILSGECWADYDSDSGSAVNMVVGDGVYMTGMHRASRSVWNPYHIYQITTNYWECRGFLTSLTHFTLHSKAMCLR